MRAPNVRRANRRMSASFRWWMTPLTVGAAANGAPTPSSSAANGGRAAREGSVSAAA